MCLKASSHSVGTGSRTSNRPTFRTRTSSPSTRHSLGNLTAWLPPFLKTLARKLVVLAVRRPLFFLLAMGQMYHTKYRHTEARSDLRLLAVRVGARKVPPGLVGARLISANVG